MFVEVGMLLFDLSAFTSPLPNAFPDQGVVHDMIL